MTPTRPHDALTFPITQTIIDRALRLARTQPPETAERAYRNAIAVLIAQNYCTLLDFETDLSQSDALQPLTCLISHTADLPLTGIGSIECCVIDLETDRESDCYTVPLEAAVDKAAYLAISLEADTNRAQILGFSPTLRSGSLMLNQLQSLDDFGSYLMGLQEAQVSAPIRVMQWLEDCFERGWQTAQTLVDTIATEVDQAMNPPEFAFRSADTTTETSPASSLCRSMKTIQFGADSQVALHISLTPAPLDSLSINVTILPLSPTESLPEGLHCAILDINADPVMQIAANAGNTIQFEFDVDLGDTFSIRLTLGDLCVTEVLTV